MNFNSITTIINISIALFLTTGLIWGMRRGALKSFVRLSFLIFNCIFWVLITPEISHFILNTNLYPLINVTVGGQTFTTIADVTNYFLTTSPAILDFVASSPIIASFIEQVPSIVANFVVFITGYFLLKSITLPVYAFVVNRIIKLIQMKSVKQIDPDKKKLRSRFLGAFFGLVQSALTGMILFLPISTLSIVLSGAEGGNLFSLSNLAVTQNIQSETANTPAPLPPTITPNKINEFVNIYYNTVLSNTLNAMNLNGLNEFLFNELSTIYVNDVKISLAEELKNANKVIQQTNGLLQKHNITNLSETTSADWLKLIATVNYNDAEKLVNNLFKLKSLQLIGDDVLNYLTKNILTSDNTMPTYLEDLPESMLPILNNLSLSLRSGNIRLLKEDLLSLLKVAETLQKNGLFDFANNSSVLNNIQQAKLQNNDELLQQTFMQIVNSLLQKLAPKSEKTLKDELITPLFNSATVRRIIPDVINLLIDVTNESLNLNIEKLNRVSVSWSNETTKLAKLTYLVKEVGKDIPLNNGFNLTDPTLLQQVSFEKIGALLNTLRESQLFSYLYENTLTQVFTNYFVPIDEQNNKLNFEFISVKDTNWQQEFKKIDEMLKTFNSIMLHITNEDFENLDASKITLLLEKAFQSNLVKEVLVKSKNLLPQIILGYLDDLPLSEKAQPILNTAKISLQEMTIDQIYNDLITFSNMLNVVLSINVPDLVSKLLTLNELQIKNLLEQFNTSYIGTKLLPQSLNLVIAKANDMFNLNIIYLPEVVTLTSNDIAKISSAIANVKTVYDQYLKLDTAEKEKEVYSINEVIKNLNLQPLGSAINNLKSVASFYDIYNDVINNIILNKELLNKLANTNLFTYLQLTQTEIDNINWELEFNMIKQAALIGIDAGNIREFGYNSIRTDLFLQNYGESKFLKLGFINAVLSLYPNADIQTMINLNLTKSAQSIGGIAEAIFLFLDFKYNGTSGIELIEKYRIREALKQIDSNTTLLTFMESLTNINTIKYAELAPLVDTLVLLLEGKEFSIKEFSKYLNVAPLIPWIVDLIEKISQGYKMPYNLNIYMKVDLFNTRIKLYGIHLGKQTSTDETGSTTPIDTQTVIDLMKQLSLIPSFVTAQFVYDPNFVQPSITN